MTNPDSLQYHTQLSRQLIEDAEYAIMPGDPGRVEPLAKAFDPNPKFLSDHRGYKSYLASFHGQKVLVVTSGIGGPSISTVMEELAVIGVKHFLRIGTCGALQAHIKVGELIISRASVRLDGASSHYAPIEYPAVASMRFTMDAVEAAENLKLPYHIGITGSSDTFYPGQERYDNYTHYVPRRFQHSLEEWRQLNVANFEMESATLFTMANVFGLEAACICGVVVNRTNSEHIDPDVKEKLLELWGKLAADTIYRSMKRRGLIK